MESKLGFSQCSHKSRLVNKATDTMFENERILNQLRVLLTNNFDFRTSKLGQRFCAKLTATTFALNNQQTYITFKRVGS